MALGLQIAFGVGIAVVALSLVGVVYDWISVRVLLATTAGLVSACAASAILLGLDLAGDRWDTSALVLATGGLGAAAVAEAGLAALSRGLGRLRALERLTQEALAELDSFVQQSTAEHTSELERTIARERANALHALGEQERRLAEERRDRIVVQVEQARGELTESVASVQERLERRLTAWAADLDRGQRELEARLGELAHRQDESLQAYESRLASDAEALDQAADEQRSILTQLRTDLDRRAREAFQEAQSELDVHTAERRRALQDVAEQLREREKAQREQLEREAGELQTHLASTLRDVQRRQLEALEKALERAAARLVEDAERRFDSQIKESREKSAERLSRELEKAMEQFARQAEKDVADRIASVAQTTAERLQKRIDDLGRAGEAQYEVSGGRMRLLAERLDEAVAGAEERISELEARIEIEVASRLAAIERAVDSGRE
jgi:uncharacterized protein YukE